MHDPHAAAPALARAASHDLSAATQESGRHLPSLDRSTESAVCQQLFIFFWTVGFFPGSGLVILLITTIPFWGMTATIYVRRRMCVTKGDLLFVDYGTIPIAAFGAMLATFIDWS